MAFLYLIVAAGALAVGVHMGYRGLSYGARGFLLALSFLAGAIIAASGETDVGAMFALGGVAFLAGSLFDIGPQIDLKARPEYRFCPNCSHKLETRDFEGKPKLACPRCTFVHWNNPIMVGVGLVPSEDGDSILLVKRGVAPKQGFWCLPGGFGEPHEHPKQTAGRETGEEAKLKVEIDRLLAVHGAPGANQALVFYLMKPTSVLPSPGSDALEARYFRLDELPENIAFSTHLEVINDWKRAWLAAKSK
jgi:ADP-ribose pyrophosphatase YjhB (NUDIX family)